MRILRFIAIVLIGAGMYCAGFPAHAAEKAAIYQLGAGDRLRVNVFEEADLSGEFEVDGTGAISLPLIGEVAIAGRSLREAERIIEAKFQDGYLRHPRVSVEVLNYRPFYILGEVKEPGSYSYVNGMTVLNAVALAGGYTYRAREDRLLIVRGADPERNEEQVSVDTVVLPGDIIRVPERFF